jgi:hypothetical protein
VDGLTRVEKIYMLVQVFLGQYLIIKNIMFLMLYGVIEMLSILKLQHQAILPIMVLRGVLTNQIVFVITVLAHRIVLAIHYIYYQIQIYHQIILKLLIVH